jgi:hypothetical protein
MPQPKGKLNHPLFIWNRNLAVFHSCGNCHNQIFFCCFLENNLFDIPNIFLDNLLFASVKFSNVGGLEDRKKNNY